MKDLKTGPFKRTIDKKNKPIKTHNGIITFALILLTITQIPIALKSSIDLLCIYNNEETQASKFTFCK